MGRGSRFSKSGLGDACMVLMGGREGDCGNDINQHQIQPPKDL